jgi:hypothetical protein
VNREQDQDRGSTLIMAIVFVTVIAMVIAGALSYSAASLNGASRAYVPSRDRLYASDAAMKATVAYIVAHPSEGRSLAGGACKPARTYGTVRDQPVTVQVCPQGATSLTTMGGGSSWGLLTMAIGAEKGLVVSGKGGIQINGNVSVNSAIDVANNSLLNVVGGTVAALGGGCAVDKVIVDGVGVANCTVASAPAVDPVYTTGLTAAPAAAAGSCNGTSKIATLGPGTWTQTTFDAAIGSCNYVWLQPGVHYLQDINWSIKNKVIGGTLPNGTGGMATSALGAGCSQSSPGAMLLLGGTTAISLSGSTPSFEVCGRTTTQAGGRSVPIPLFGPTTDINAPTTGTLTVSGATAPSGTSWSSPANAKSIDNKVATYTLAKNKASNVLSIPGYSGTVAIPATATSLNAVVNAVTSPDATVTLTARNNGDTVDACTGTTSPNLPIGTAVSATTTVTVTLACTKALVAPLTLRVVVTAPNTSSNRAVKLDGVNLSYGDPGPTIKAACATCTVLSGGGNGNSVWLGGEVYLPRGKISLQLPATSTTLSTLGMVVRVLDLQTTGSTAVLPIIATDNGALYPGDVTVTTKVGDVVWTSCRVTYGVTGAAVTSSKVLGCTVPR